RVLAAALITTLLAVTHLASAQPRLIVNGRAIEGNTTGLVSGTSYAPAAPLASALGATAAVDRGRGLVVLDAGGRFLQIAIAATPQEATTLDGAIRLDGSVVPGPAAV